MKILKYEGRKEDGYNVYYTNGVYLGDILPSEDGFYNFWPKHPSEGGYWSSYILREIADKLDELNNPWEKQIEEYFSHEKTTPL